MKMKKVYVNFVLILFLVLLHCAATVRIGDIKETPTRFRNKKVTITGTVDQTLTLPILGVGVYQLNDGTGKIWVKPKQKIPEKGDHVMVTGTVKVGITISGRSFGLILIESKSEEPY
ncbi:MAG: hypothetical protein JSW07_11905 [bacterium]|nr:MAG: hypothetical protein JSW07_11905 [bacterium]